MAKKKQSALSVQPPDPKEKQLSPAQLAARLTWQLKGDLKNAQIAYLRVAVKLARVRDEKMYVDLKHENMEQYAKEKLRLGRSSLYNYLRVYDWVLKNHKEWLEPHPKGFIPDLSDAAGAMSIEKELAKKNLQTAKRKTLKALHRKALNGDLKEDDLEGFRKRSAAQKSTIDAILEKQRSLRGQAAKEGLPAEVLAHMDAIIGILENHGLLSAAGFDENVTWT
jgi:hypothetical protein